MSTDKLFIGKLSNAIQQDDFKLLGKITYDKNKKELISKWTVMMDIFKVRGMKNNDIIRLKSYLSYLKKKF